MINGSVPSGKMVKKLTGAELLITVSNADSDSFHDNSTVKFILGILIFDGDNFS